jgi:hypothetical protein
MVDPIPIENNFSNLYKIFILKNSISFKEISVKIINNSKPS